MSAFTWRARRAGDGMFGLFSLFIIMCGPAALLAAGDIQSLSVHPKDVALDGLASQRLAVMGVSPDGLRDLTRAATFASSDEKICKIDARGQVFAIGNGVAKVTVTAAGKTAEVPVTIKNAVGEQPVEFTRQVEPILTKLGCNQGACHGGQHGKGGFRLSLRGFDPIFDHNQIVQSAEGRRIVLSDPERSILLAKPALLMEHGGGERLKPGGPDYLVLKRWLEDGVPAPTAKDPEVQSIEVWPSSRLMQMNEQQQMIVRARWSDGRFEDVTHTASYDSLNDAVAGVSPEGLVTAKGKGETHIMVRFEGSVGVFQVTLPYTRVEPYPEQPRQNFIDDFTLAKWKELGLVPSPTCSDQEFFRRIHLDTIGTLPTPDEVKAFLADKDPKKRDKAIDKVLDRPEFVDFWALKWGDHLRINRDRLKDKGMWSFHNWVRASVRDNKKVDQFVREIVTAEGSTFTDGPANYYGTGTPADWAETTAQLFLGVRIQCAKCHHHPFEKWSQDDYYGMSAFFVRLSSKNSQEFGLFGGERVLHLKETGEQNHPRKGGVVKPHPLDGNDMDDVFDRRRKLAEWMTAKDNAFFARNIVNRFWGYYLGRGLVEPIDDMRATNPASNPALLDALAKDFVGHDFNFKHLLGTIMRSRTYQLSSERTEGNRADAINAYFARYTVKRLTAEQLADAIDYATGTREKYDGLPLGTRAIQLPDPEIKSYLMDIFGRPARQIICECERTMQPNIAQALHLLNGDFLNNKIGNAQGRLEKHIQAKTPVRDVIEEFYLITASRPPRPEELQRLEELVKSAPSQKEGLQDILWALLNSREFLFNH